MAIYPIMRMVRNGVFSGPFQLPKFPKQLHQSFAPAVSVSMFCCGAYIYNCYLQVQISVFDVFVLPRLNWSGYNLPALHENHVVVVVMSGQAKITTEIKRIVICACLCWLWDWFSCHFGCFQFSRNDQKMIKTNGGEACFLVHLFYRCDD